jgi:protein phosphatase 1 regulatory subunit 7
VIDLTANRLTRLGGAFDAQAALEDLWLGYNRLASFEALSLPRLARSCPRLATVYLEHNDIARDWEYRKTLARLLPSVTQIDADAVRRA